MYMYGNNNFQNNNNNQMPFGNQSGTNQFNRPNSAGNAGNQMGGGNNNLFGPNASSNNLFGNNSMGGGGGGGSSWNSQNQLSNNNNLFTRNTNNGGGMNNNNPFQTNQNNNTNNNNLFQGSSGNNNNLFRSNTMGSNGGGNNNMLGNNNSNMLSNSNSLSNNNLFNQNRYNTRSSTLTNTNTMGNNGNTFDGKGTINIKWVPKRGNDNMFVHSITYKDCPKSLEELRIEDYAFIKSNNLPDNIRSVIRNNIQNLEGGGMMGNNNMNSMFNQGGGMGNNNNMMGNNNSNHMFGNNAQRTWPGINSGNNNGNSMFQNNNGGGMGNNNNNLFANNNNGGMQGGGMGNNNPFQNNNNNLFNQQNNNANSNFFNNNNNNQMGNNNNNNLFNGPNRFQPTNNSNNMLQNNNSMQNSMNSGGMGGGAANFLVNRQGQNPMMQGGGANNNLFVNRMGNQNGFPQQGGQQMGFFPGQNNQFQQNGFFPGQNQQQFPGSNPHLFPPQSQGMPGQPNQMGQFYQGFPQQQYPMYPDGSNPHLFPHGPTPYPYFYGYPGQMNPYANPNMNPGAMQNSVFPPYQEDKSQSLYTPRTTLSEVVANLEQKLAKENLSPNRSSSYLPYNPFIKKGVRKGDFGGERETTRNSALQWNQINHSLLRKQEDPFTLIKKSKYLEDDVEIIMKPKAFISQARNRSYSPVGGRNRSSSPLSNRSRDISGDHPPSRHSGKNIYNSTLKVQVGVKAGKEIIKNVDIKIFSKARCFDLKLKCLEMLKNMNMFRTEVAESISAMDEIAAQSVLIYNTRSVPNDTELDQLKMGDESCCFLEIPADRVNPKIFEDRRRSSPFENTPEVEVSSFTSNLDYQALNSAPKLSNPEYATIPSIEQLQKMSARELAAVDGFTIYNKKGKIEFEGRTDVRGVDLDQAVVISFKNVEVYPDDKFKDSKPIPGEKLNRPALITLYECYSNKRKTQKENEEKARRLGYEFIDHDETNGVYRIRVKHF